MPMKRIRPAAVLAAAGVLATLAFMIWALIDEPVWWRRTLAWTMALQADLHRQLAQAMRLVGQEGWPAAVPLIGLSLLYGVFHAAGPGHGKAVMTAYLGTRRVRWPQGVRLAVLASLIQGATAVLLVEIAASLLDHSLRGTQRVGAQLENLSFALIALLGAILLMKGAATLYRRHRRRPETPPGALFTQGAGMRAYCADCDALHELAGAHAGGPGGWRTGLPVALAIGIRPCTGALLVLLAAYAMNLRWAGIAAVMAMSAGTAATVSALALGAVSLRGGLLGMLARGPRPSHHAHVILDILGVVGGLCIFLMGIGLLRQGLRIPAHPLL